MEWTPSDYSAFLERLECLKSWPDPHDAEMHDRILATGKRIIGVRTPDIRNIVKEIIKDNHNGSRPVLTDHRKQVDPAIDSFLKCARDRKCFDTFETSISYGLVSAKTKDFENYKRRMTPFIENADTWAEVDVVVGDSTVLKKLTPEMERWVFGLTEHTDKPFVIRFGIISLMKYFTAGKYRRQVLDACSSVPKENYYVRMAVAWLLAEHYLYAPEEIAEYLSEDFEAYMRNRPSAARSSGTHSVMPHLDVWTHNKAIQKACESFRVSDSDKSMLKSLRLNDIRKGKETCKASLAKKDTFNNGRQ
jgi:3-methyladenine DNA glycosylase AlkD